MPGDLIAVADCWCLWRTRDVVGLNDLNDKMRELTSGELALVISNEPRSMVLVLVGSQVGWINERAVLLT